MTSRDIVGCRALTLDRTGDDAPGEALLEEQVDDQDRYGWHYQ
jgi:hypothetical protein